jgi:hypothetical protein
LALAAPPLAPCHPPESSVLSFSPFRLFLSAVAASEEQKQPITAEKEKTMEFTSNDHSNSRQPSFVASLRADGRPSTQAVIAANIQHLITQLEQGHSEVLTQYLTTMARFHKYSFDNVC